jgi:hypothetical protein
VDITHESGSVALSLPVWGSGVDVLLRARITSRPFSGPEHTAPTVTIETSGDEVMEGLDPTDLDSVIAQVERHVEALREIREQLARARHEHEAERRR